MARGVCVPLVHPLANVLRPGARPTDSQTSTPLSDLSDRYVSAALDGDVEAALVGAAMVAGLGEAEARRTFASGWTRGTQTPRAIARGRWPRRGPNVSHRPSDCPI